MRSFILLCCTTVFSLTGEYSFSQNEKVLIKSDMTITVYEVFDIIKKQSDYRFIFHENLFEGLQKVSLKKGKISIEQLIQKSISSGNFKLHFSDKKTILITENNNLQQNITGVVTDENSLPLAGVNIIVKGTQKGVLTDFNGGYQIAASSNDILSFSFLGYVTQDITVANNVTINVKLSEDINVLDEVLLVSTGYREILKEKSVGKVSTADVSVLKNRSTSNNVLDRLDGLVAGLVVNPAPNSGAPILIRGLNSVNGNRSPLFVVDGVPITDISRINPQDVESVNVLKDAVAAALYGSRATNGIIIINTKKGSANKKLQIDYDSFTKFTGKPDLDYLPRLNSQQFIQTAEEIFDPSRNLLSNVSTYGGLGRVTIQPHEQILYDRDQGLIDNATANARLNALANFNNSNQVDDLFFRNASLTTHTLSARGGGEKYNFYASMAYTNDQSDRPGEDNKSYKLNFNQNLKLSKRLSINLTTDVTNSRLSNKRALNIDRGVVPYIRFRDENGNNLNTNFMRSFSEAELPGFESDTGINLQYNPLDEFDSGYTRTDNLNVRMRLGLNLKLFKGLVLEGNYGYLFDNNNRESFDKEDSYRVRLERALYVQPGPIYFLPETGGHYTTDVRKQRDWIVRNQLNYTIGWNDNKHQINALVGQELQENFFTSASNFTRGYDDKLLTTEEADLVTLSTGLSGVVLPTSPSSGRSFLRGRAPLIRDEENIKIESYYANFNYTYNTKYILNGSWRIDESSLFGIDKSAQNRATWSVGGKWLLGKEAFMENTKAISNLALRATFGLTGNAPLPRTSASEDIIRPIASAFLSGTNGAIIRTPKNDKLTWESTDNFNVGLDFGLFNRRVKGSIDYYQKKTKDLIGRVDTNILTGYTNVVGNLGDMENKGFELSLETLNISTKNFSWITYLNFAHNKNEITRLISPFPITSAELFLQQQFVEGKSAFAIHAYDYAGLDELGDPQIRLADGTIIKDGAVSADDTVYMGSSIPDITGGLSNTFNYKNFSLNANIRYSFGAVLRADTPGIVDYGSGGRLIPDPGNFTTGNVHSDFFNRWRQPGDEAITNIPSYVSDPNENVNRRNIEYYTRGSINVVSADYIKLRDITLSYRFPEAVKNKINADISFRLQLSNVMLWKANDRNIDPEFHDAFGAARSNILDQETITAGIHITL
ncbi:TonB-dependent receptor [Flavivirga amylovorans]